MLLSGCSTDLGSSLGLDSGGGTGLGAKALVVGDEPYAVQTGAQILQQGGSAVDAAAAMYFTLSVTYPVAAGLGGGGICIVRDGASGQIEEFDFLARDASSGGAYAVPGNAQLAGGGIDPPPGPVVHPHVGDVQPRGWTDAEVATP